MDRHVWPWELVQRKFFGYFLSLAEFPAEDSHCYWMLHNSNPHRCMLYMKEAEAALPTSASVTLTPSLSQQAVPADEGTAAAPGRSPWALGQAPSHTSDNFSVEHLVMGNCNPSDMPGGPENCLTSLIQDQGGHALQASKQFLQMKGQQPPQDDDPGPHPSDNFSVEHLVMGNCNPSDMPGGPESCLTSLTQDQGGDALQVGLF
ncbi:Adhesion G protein-coupled receptor B1 [Camelus dromedarius]|uniref:Adhesion G protein-coupled receptor B1 n=1 Tax=Camelus dromedarius TaxID=9838 RepID=A0A5N4EC92_CAMDR|nr:Adhesion G protein-coupled receptor B1 [Camelus dromedarius]